MATRCNCKRTRRSSRETRRNRASEPGRLPVLPEDRAESVHDLPLRAPRPGAVDQRLHQVDVRAGGPDERLERPGGGGPVATLPELTDARDLALLHLGRDHEDVDGW